MNITALTSISPIDGRYRNKTEELANYFSEYALIKYRVHIEIEYFIELCLLPLSQLKKFDNKYFTKLRKIYSDFTIEDAGQIKNIEKITNHDVKAVEYFLKECFDKLGLSQYKEFIHFGLTSQDINNTAVPLSLKDALNNVYHPLIAETVNILNKLSEQWKSVAMLSRTHGQPATPTLLGKEIKVFTERLSIQLNQLRSMPFPAKFGGTVGNFNAHHVAYPQVDWIKFGNHLVNDILGLSRTQTTTQIEHYDNLGAIFDCLKRINTIMLDLTRDIWTYISMDYFKQKIKETEVSSSTMPHKINPIDFENAEGNLGIANAVFEYLSAKLPVSRLQRDLTDSTVLRNIGVPVSHTIIALKSLNKGLSKLFLNEETIKHDLDNNWSIIAEAIQTILRREGYPKPYEALKDLTRTHRKITKESIHSFIDKLEIGDKVKKELKKISPGNYTGVY
jgi:adenylosuccinate lyase